MPDSTAMEDKQERLMEQLRKDSNKIRSFDEYAQLLHVISSEQKARKMLRLCTDKVLMNISDIHSLRDLLDRLRSVARTNGLFFNLMLEKQTMGSETSCRISGDLFDVEIVLDGSDNHLTGPAVLDVKISYSKQVKSCPELVEIIRNGRFLDLSKHFKALIELYPMSMDRTTKTKVYMALQSLETDVSKMSQLYLDSHKDVDGFNIVMHGLVGLLAPRVMGMCFQLHYFLTPYDLLDTKTATLKENFDQLDEKTGLLAEIRIKSHSNACSLPITPLISNNHPVSGSGKPRFPDVNQHNSVSLPACFVLKLKPKVLIVQQIANEIEKETGMPLFGKDTEMESYLSSLKTGNKILEALFEDNKHIYNLNVKHLKAGFVEEILFTHPSHVVTIINSLRKQSYLNCVFESCFKTKKAAGTNVTVWHYDVTLGNNMENLHVTFQHPLSLTSTAFAEIVLSGDGFSSCRLFTSRSDPILCSDQYALTILQKSFSLPILMRAIMLQTKRSPRKEPDRNRSSRQSIYQHRATSIIAKKAPPPPVSQSQPKRPAVSAPNSSVSTSTPIASSQPMFQASFLPTTMQSAISAAAAALDHAKKESQHPMLTQLLKPAQGSSLKTQNATVQPKSHPMLLGLLKENEAKGMMQHQSPSPQQLMPQRPQQHATPPPPQYGATPQLTMPYGQQMSQQQPQNQMPPPPSYYASGQQKPTQQQYQSPQQMTNYSNPSPLGFEDLGNGPPSIPQLPSPFNAQSSASHATTPPLFAMMQSPLASPSSQTSPMNFIPSPRQPPMNTPQPIPSPRHNAMTPPILSPAGRKMSISRRGSRQKSRSIDQSGFDTRSDVMGEIGFGTSFDMIHEPENNQLMDMQDVFSAGLSPAHSQQASMQAIPSPAMSSARSQRHLSGDRGFNFSFESDLLDVDPNNQRRTPYGRRTSSQPFMTPSPALSTQESQDTAFPMPSPANSVENFQSASFAMTDTKQSITDMQQHMSFGHKPVEMTSSAEIQPDSKTFLGKTSQPEQMESIFDFDDNRTPQKISMPDSMSDQKNRAAILSRSSSISSNSGAEETTLKGLLSSAAGGVNFNKTTKADKITSNQTGKTAAGAAGQRRGSTDYVTSGSRLGESASVGGPGHKPLVRQNAIGKGMSKFQSLQSEAREKPKKKSVKDDKGPPRRRGRPPSTDKKEHILKRKKAEGMVEDSEQRGKIVLNIQLNKGTPISSNTKTKPVPSDPPAEKTPSASSNTSSAATPSSVVDQPNLENLQHDSPGLLAQYFRAQTELEKKKKEKKFATGSSSPMQSMNKNNNKSISQAGSGLTGNASAIRSQLSSSKSVLSGAGGAAKSSNLPHQKSGPTASQVKAGSRPRKASLKDAVDKIKARAESGQGQSTNAPEKGPTSGSTTPKNADRSGGSEQVANTVKLKGVPPSTGPKLSQMSNLLVSKSQGGVERAVAVKPSGGPKQGVHSKSPGSHVPKQAVGPNRPTVQAKRDRSRPVTPIRDSKASGAPTLKGQQLSAMLSSSKTEKSSKAPDSMISQSKSGQSPGELAKRTMPSRPPSANKSPRSVTPPQARHLSQGGAMQSKTERLQTVHGRRSPAQAQEPGKLESNPAKRPSSQELSFLPPPAKKLLTDSAILRESPTEDRLVIDDGTDDVSSVTIQNRMSETPPISHPPPPSLTHAVNSMMNPIVSVSPLNSAFPASPAVECDIDDDLMNVAVSDF